MVEVDPAWAEPWDLQQPNLQIEGAEKIAPGNGVYAVQVVPESPVTPGTFPENLLLNGMMNIGVRPTVDGTNQVIEVNIFDFNQDLYHKKLRVYVKAHLRAEQKFHGLDELKDQLKKTGKKQNPY